MSAVVTENIKKLSAAAAGGCFVAITQLATRDKIDTSDLVAIGCFSVTLPIFVTAATIPGFQAIQSGSALGTITSQVIGWSLSLFALGVASVLWSFGWYFAVASGAVAVACFLIARKLP